VHTYYWIKRGKEWERERKKRNGKKWIKDEKMLCIRRLWWNFMTAIRLIHANVSFISPSHFLPFFFIMTLCLLYKTVRKKSSLCHMIVMIIVFQMCYFYYTSLAFSFIFKRVLRIIKVWVQEICFCLCTQ